MNYLDIIFGLLLVWAVYRGFVKGFIIALASLIALIAGIYGAIHFSQVLDVYVYRFLHPRVEYVHLISFSCTFLLIVAMVYLLAYIVESIIKATGLGFINRLSGMVFNFGKMAFILSVIISLLNYAGDIRPLIPEKDRKESLLYEPLSKIAPAIFPYLKFEHFKERLKDKDVPSRQILTQAEFD